MIDLRSSVATLAIAALAWLPLDAMAQEQPAVAPEPLVEPLVEPAADAAVAPATPDADAIAERLAGDAVPEEPLLTDGELDDLVAPIALYPDALLAQVLVASTFPLQIVKADRIISDSEGQSDAALSETLSEQELDPSVLVLLSGFPTVVQRMSADLDDTERLGIAMLQQDDDVLAAVQRLRADARDMGYLSDNEAQTVEEDPSGEIAIKPADPEVVYVPTYDPEVVYTSPAPAQPYYVAPAQQAAAPSPFSAQSLLTTGAIAFGSALLVNELWGDDDDDDDHDNWDGYWRRPQPINWQNREFYPRPSWNGDRAAAQRSWDWERDRAWRRDGNQWRRQADLDRQAAARDRARALGAMANDPSRVREIRGSGAWQSARDQRERDLMRAREERARADRAGTQAQRDRAAREKAAEHARDQRRKADQKQGRDDARAKASKDAQKKANDDAKRKAAADDAKRKAAAQEDKRKAASDDAKRKAAAQDDKRKAAADDAKRKAAAQDAKRKAAADDAKRKAAADARAKEKRDADRAKAAQDAQRQQAEQKQKAAPKPAQPAKPSGNSDQSSQKKKGDDDKKNCRNSDDKDCRR